MTVAEIRLDPRWNDLDVDRYCASHGLTIIRFLPGRVKSARASERQHLLFAVSRQ